MSKRIPVPLNEEELKLLIQACKDAYYSDTDKIREKLEEYLMTFDEVFDTEGQEND